MAAPKWEFWVDRGGTFTDIIARNPEGLLVTYKLLSDNPAQYKDAVIEGIRKILGLKINDRIPGECIASINIGTTVATNALLERKGDRIVLAVTSGFRDALRIGYQNRPELFNLHIELPDVLYAEVIEIDERISAGGDVLYQLDEKTTEQKLRRAYDNGYRSIAIVLMHGYRYARHEIITAELARKTGFTRISVSHETAPVAKWVSRGETTVVDAYLSPVLQKYIKQLNEELGGVPLFFMQSSGGLVHQ